MIDGMASEETGIDAMIPVGAETVGKHDQRRPRGDGVVELLDAGDGVSRRAVLRDQLAAFRSR